MNSVLIGPGSTRQTRTPRLGQLAAQGVIPVRQSRLGRSVGAQGRVGHAGDRRADVDDHAFAFDQRGQAEPRQQQGCGEVDGELAGDLIGLGVGELRRQPSPALLIRTSIPPNRR